MIRYLTRSNHKNMPETVLQYKNESGEWVDVPTVYTEEVFNDHHNDWNNFYTDENGSHSHRCATLNSDPST
jgi:hypothetical protein